MARSRSHSDCIEHRKLIKHCLAAPRCLQGALWARCPHANDICIMLLQVLPPDQQLRLRKRQRSQRSTRKRKRHPDPHADSATETDCASDDSDDGAGDGDERGGGDTNFSLGTHQLKAVVDQCVAPLLAAVTKQQGQQAAFNHATVAALTAMQRDLQQLGSMQQAAVGGSSQGVSFDKVPTMAGLCTRRSKAAVQLHQRELLMRQVAPVAASHEVLEQAHQHQQQLQLEQAASHDDPGDSLMLLAAAAAPELLAYPASGAAHGLPSSSSDGSHAASSVYCCVIKGRMATRRAELVHVQLPRPVDRGWRIPNAVHTPQERRTPQWLQWHGKQLGGELLCSARAVCFSQRDG